MALTDSFKMSFLLLNTDFSDLKDMIVLNSNIVESVDNTIELIDNKVGKTIETINTITINGNIIAHLKKHGLILYYGKIL